VAPLPDPDGLSGLAEREVQQEVKGGTSQLNIAAPDSTKHYRLAL